MGGGMGMVNFFSAQPTKTWHGRLTTRVGSYSRTSTIATVQGSAGAVGLAFTSSVGGYQSPLAGLHYLDTSGFDYVHSGARTNRGDLLTLQSTAGKNNTISGTLMSSNHYRDLTTRRR